MGPRPKVGFIVAGPWAAPIIVLGILSVFQRGRIVKNSWIIIANPREYLWSVSDEYFVF